MPQDRVLMEDKFTADEAREAVRLFSAAKRHGTLNTLPDWVHEAKTQYARTYNRDHKRVRNHAGISAGVLPALEPDNIIDPSVTEIIDWTAIEIAVKGTRVVNMTRDERLIAVAWMLDKLEMTYVDIADRIGMSQISTLVRDIRQGKVKDLLAQIEAGDLDASGSPLKF